MSTSGPFGTEARHENSEEEDEVDWDVVVVTDSDSDSEADGREATPISFRLPENYTLLPPRRRGYLRNDCVRVVVPDPAFRGGLLT